MVTLQSSLHKRPLHVDPIDESANGQFALDCPSRFIFASRLYVPLDARVAAAAQSAAGPIGSLAAGASGEVKVAGAVTLSGSNTLLGNGSTVTAGQATLPIHLTRGGELDLCATTELHLSQQANAADPNSPLMLTLDRGAIEAHYSVGKNSDVVQTPDLSILLSGPGKADVRIRVNAQGDTCVDNRGANAPYVTVSEQMGSWRVSRTAGPAGDVRTWQRSRCRRSRAAALRLSGGSRYLRCDRRQFRSKYSEARGQTGGSSRRESARRSQFHASRYGLSACGE